MNAFLETIRNLGPVRLASLGAVAIGLVAFFAFLMSRLAAPDMALLYGELDARDSAQIIGRLEGQGVGYQLSADGGRILVPAGDVARLRLTMAEAGLPSGGSVGYEIFDSFDSLGTTTFQQNVSLVRALEGELSRTIGAIAGVRSARVHLVLPQRELFSRDRQEATASIVLRMDGAHRLTTTQVQAVRHLVAAAVPRLDPTSISIIDDRGTLLARGGDAELQALSGGDERRRAHEQRLALTVQELLERTLGPGRARVSVVAEMDFDRIVTSTESFDPDSQVARSTQFVEEELDEEDGAGDQPVTVATNLPDAEAQIAAAGGRRSRTSRLEETINYEISRTREEHVREVGAVRRLSVAVLVDGTYAPQGDTPRAYVPRDIEELDKIAALVRTAIGFDSRRGDTVEVVNMPFAVDAVAEDQGYLPLGLDRQDAIRLAELLVLGVVGILIVLMVLRPLTARLLEFTRNGGLAAAGTPLLADGTRSLPALEGPPGTAVSTALASIDPTRDSREELIDLDKVEGRVRASSIKKITEIIEKHPDEAVTILRGWMFQES